MRRAHARGAGETRVNAQFRFALIVGATSHLCPTLPTRADHGAADPAAMLRRAAKLEDLRADGALPFALHARIAGKLGEQNLSGTYELTWVSENRWHEELTLNGFKRVRDGTEGGYWQVSTVDHKPLVMFELGKILNVAALAHLNPEQTAEKAPPREGEGATDPQARFRDSEERSSTDRRPRGPSSCAPAKREPWRRGRTRSGRGKPRPQTAAASRRTPHGSRWAGCATDGETSPSMFAGRD